MRIIGGEDRQIDESASVLVESLAAREAPPRLTYTRSPPARDHPTCKSSKQARRVTCGTCFRHRPGDVGPIGSPPRTAARGASGRATARFRTAARR
jgi:hypothetical protein